MRKKLAEKRTVTFIKRLRGEAWEIGLNLRKYSDIF